MQGRVRPHGLDEVCEQVRLARLPRARAIHARPRSAGARPPARGAVSSMDRPPRSSCRPATTPSSVTTPMTALVADRESACMQVVADRGAAIGGGERQRGTVRRADSILCPWCTGQAQATLRVSAGFEHHGSRRESRVASTGDSRVPVPGRRLASLHAAPRCRNRDHEHPDRFFRPIGCRCRRVGGEMRGRPGRLASAMGRLAGFLGRPHSPWLRPEAWAARWSRSTEGHRGAAGVASRKRMRRR